MPEPISIEEMRGRVGQAFAPSRWFGVDQDRIDSFADVTEDWQYIHVDNDAAAKSPFGGTIAHGFLSVSLLSAMAYDAIPKVKNYPMGVNYGFDRLRFVSPVKSGARVRAHFVLDGVDADEDHVALRYDVRIEIEGEDRPAIVAIWLGRAYRDQNASPT